VAALGCEPGAGLDSQLGQAVMGLTVTNLHATSMELSWRSPEPAHARLRYGLESTEEQSLLVGTEASTEHLIQLHLLRPGTEYSFEVELLDGDEVVDSESGSFVTNEVPDLLPELEVELDELDEHRFIVTSLLGDPHAAVVIHQDGYYAWWHIEVDDGLTLARARMGPGGESIYYSAYDRGEWVGPDAVYEFRRVVLGEGIAEKREARYHHHDFVVLDDGTIGWIRSDHQEVEGETYRGDAIVETAPDGAERVVWSSWDHLEHGLSPDCNDSTGTIWTHANALHYDPDSDTYHISVREMDTVVAVDRASGETLWELGGCESDFDMSGTLGFDGQHQIQPVDGGLLLYDNRPSEAYSRVVEFALDHDAGTATERWIYSADDAYLTDILGDVHRLPSGDTIVTWSTTGRMEQVDQHGELRWQARFGFGTVVGYGEPLEW